MRFPFLSVFDGNVGAGLAQQLPACFPVSRGLQHEPPRLSSGTRDRLQGLQAAQEGSKENWQSFGFGQPWLIFELSQEHEQFPYLSVPQFPFLQNEEEKKGKPNKQEKVHLPCDGMS